MEIRATSIPQCRELIPRIMKDERGRFVKTFHEDIFAEHGLETLCAEEYYTVSRKGVLRGLHFQTPPAHHSKMVYCIAGEVMDAVVDLRVGSPTFGKFETFTLDTDTANMVYIPAGLAHGFYVVSESAIVMYRVSTVYAPEHDTGVLWNSVGIPWPDRNPRISERDRGFPPLEDFQSPFIFAAD